MAEVLSGSFYTDFGTNNGYRLRLDWSATQDIAANTSTITAKIYLISLGSSYYITSSVAKTLHITIAGQTFTNTAYVSLSGNQTKLLATRIKNITHDSDGSKSFSISGDLAININFGSGYVGTVTLSSHSYDLVTIPRATQPTLGSNPTEMGQSLTINTPRADSAFTHTLSYVFGAATGTIATNVATSFAWTIPLDLANQIPNNVSGYGTITCKTYKDGELVGTKTVQFTATVPSSIIPTISATPTGVDLFAGLYVQNKSKVQVDITAGGVYSSTVSSYSTVVRSGSNVIGTYSGESITSGLLAYSGTITVDCMVTDSRGRTNTYSFDISVAQYFAPAVTAFTAYRSDSLGNEDDSGDYIHIEGTSLIASLESENFPDTTLRLRQVGTTTWIDVTENTVSYNPTLSDTESASSDYSFEVQIVVSDHYSTTVQQILVPTAFALWNIYPDGNSWAFGKVAEGSAFLELADTGGVALDGNVHPWQIGPTLSQNIAFDKWGIQARNNGAVADLELNPFGGAVKANGSEVVSFETANGSDVIKLYDGTMIQYTKKTVTYGAIAANANVNVSAQTGWTFNEAFLYTPVVTHTLSGSWSQALNIGLESITTSGVGTSYLYNHHNATIGSVNLTIHYMAIGRWKE